MEHKIVPYVAVNSIRAESVLVLAPHPDDEVLGCGGAIARHVSQRAPVRVVIVTDGAFGASPGERPAVAARRREESRAAAAVLGYGAPEFWDLPDQGMVYSEALVERLCAAMAEADLVYAPSILEMHPDHRTLGMAAAEAMRRLGGERQLAFYEIGVPFRPNLLLDITDVAQIKERAVGCFASQLAKQAYGDHIAALNRYRTYTLPAHVESAEAFVLVSVDMLRADPLGIYQPEYARQQELGLRAASRSAAMVSVIVRSMDRPSLQETLGSVALQTHDNIEVVIVDAHGSHTSLPRRCGPFPVVVAGEGRRLGRSEAANLGLSTARGDYVIFLDDDDLFFPDHISRLLERLRAQPQARAAYAGVRVEAETGVIDTYDEAFPPARMMAWNHLPIHAVLFERSLFDEGCRFDPERELFEDWDFWLQLQSRTPLVRAPGVSAIYRAHLGSSELTAEARGALERSERREIWGKWLKLWSPGDMEQLVEDLRATAAEAARLQAVLRHREADFKSALARLEADHAVALGEARETIRAIRASTSWRVTAPLRGVMEALKGDGR
jgi:LmbE family N-acetylglucosaminyl deacetylase/GT2 family glycosyltransferase